MKTVARMVLGCALALSIRARGADIAAPQAPGTPAASTAEKLVSQLDDPDYKVRTAADLQLNNLPGSAVAVVEAALKEGTATAESQVRLESALRILRPRAREELRNRQASE